MPVKKKAVAKIEESTEEKVGLKTVYTFVFGRNIYTVRMSDIKKITLLGHQFIDKADDKEEVAKTLYIFSVIGDQMQGFNEEDTNGVARPMFETIMEVKAEEDDYTSLYNIYEDLVIKWDAFRQSLNSSN
jgi:hypothetical protein